MKGLGQDSYDSSRMKGKDELSSRTGLFAEQERLVIGSTTSLGARQLSMRIEGHKSKLTMGMPLVVEFLEFSRNY